MFSGIVTAVGTISNVQFRGANRRLEIQCPMGVFPDLCLGESVAVNGVCLTVEEQGSDRFWATLQARTLQTTTLSRLARNDSVNLERALAMGDRIGGHMIQGHVDTVGTAERFDKKFDKKTLRVSLAQEWLRYVIRNASIAIDGVSLTVDSTDATSLSVHIIPLTYEHTILKHKKAGDVVNIEIDYLAKYVHEFVKK